MYLTTSKCLKKGSSENHYFDQIINGVNERLIVTKWLLTDIHFARALELQGKLSNNFFFHFS